MNEQMQNALVDIIQKASSGIDASVSFLSSEIPDVISQLLLWSITASSVGMALSAIVIAISVSMIVWMMKLYGRGRDTGKPNWVHDGDRYNALRERVIPVSCVLFICLVVGPIVFVVNLMEVLKIWLAPKIWLIEYAASLAK